MRRVPTELLLQLDLRGAVEAEAKALRNQLPSEPWTALAISKKVEIAECVYDKLAAGLPVTTNVIVNVRKESLGTRPVPIMGIIERVAYRALTSFVMGDREVAERSADSYRDFLFGPIGFAQDDEGFIDFLEPKVNYVVEADIAAFYQYVDHDVLKQELELQGSAIEGVDILIELLGEFEQRTFGLPQLIDASDWLSEVYIGRVERDLIRSGWPTWRYNDDFRIACTDYTEALDAIEKLGEAARLVGLTVSDYKTYTPPFWKYAFWNTGRDVHNATVEIDPSDVEAIFVDYSPIGDEQQADEALKTLERTRDDTVEDPINLRDTSTKEVRNLRRAVSSLTHHQDPAGLKFMVDLLVFVPSLTPRVCDYLMAIHSNETSEAVEATVDLALESVSLGEWQSMWFTHVCRVLGLLASSSSRLEWVISQRERGRGRPLGAEAALALAEVGAADFDDLDVALRSEPEALAPWFLLAIKAMVDLDPTQLGDRGRAVRDSGPLNRLLLDI